MLQLLHPIALFALAAVIIPVLVHLWNVRKGKTLRVGSIALLTESTRKRSNRLRIHNWPLFLLRCLLLVLLALLLAKPVWNKTPDATRQTGWVLVPGEQLAAAYTLYQPQIDSLLAAGLELHNLSAGFEIIRLADTARFHDTANNTTGLSPWSLLTVLDGSLPKGFPLHVFVNNRFVAYQGERPVTQLAIHWHSFSLEDSIRQSPVYSYVTSAGKIRNIQWVSTTSGNYYTEEPVGALSTLQPDTAVIRVAIYPGTNTADGQYLQAALKAIGQYTLKNMDVSVLAAGQAPAAPQHLIFDLDGHPGDVLSYVVPNGILFRYDTGHVVSLSSWLQEGGLVTGAAVHNKIHKYVSGPATGIPVWSLADGRPLLSVTEQDNKRVYHYKGRFNAAWGDIVWEDGFVKMILPFVMPVLSHNDRLDRRKIDDKQLVPGKRIQNPVFRIQNTEKFIKRNNDMLSNLLWLLALIAFIAERVMDYRQQQRLKNG